MFYAPPVRSALGLLFALVGLAMAGGCFGGDDASVAESELSKTVLQPSDLPAVFVRFDEGRLQLVDSPRGDEGWKARYRRPGSFATRGPLVIESRVDRFADGDRAAKAFQRLRTDVRAAEGATEVDAPAIGQGSVAVRIRQEGVNPVDFFTIAWRQANVTASLTANGFAGKISFAEAVDLARKQQRRIATVVDS